LLGLELAFALGLLRIAMQTCTWQGTCGTTWPGGGGGTGTGTVAVDQLAKLLLEGVKDLTEAAAIAAAEACATSFAAGFLVGVPGPGPCDGRQMPIYFSGGMATPDTTDHIAAAQLGGKPALLTKRPRGGAWYTGATTCNEAARAAYAGEHGGDIGVCDEYPFNTATQNQANEVTVSLRLTPSKEGSSQGGSLRGFYGKCAADGTDFVVVPVPLPVAPSFGWCPGR